MVSGQATAEGIRAYITQKSARPADLARHFNTSENVIKAIVEDPASGMIIADRGWIKLDEQPPDPPEHELEDDLPDY